MADGEHNSEGETIDVRYVAHLARLRLTDEEAETFQRQLRDVVTYVRKINELDLDGIEPTSHAHPVQNVFRADEPRAGLDHDAVVANAPLDDEGQFVVPRIVE